MVAASRSRGARAAAFFARLVSAVVVGAARAAGPRGLARAAIWVASRSGIQVSVSAATLAAVYPLVAPFLRNDGDAQP